MNRKLVGYRLPEETRQQICILEAERGENKTEVIIDAIKRLYLVHLLQKQKGKTEELVVIQQEIEKVEKFNAKPPNIVKKEKKGKIMVVG